MDTKITKQKRQSETGYLLGVKVPQHHIQITDRQTIPLQYCISVVTTSSGHI